MALAPAKSRVLILTDYFLPGFKADALIRSLVNQVEQLGDEFQCRVITAIGTSAIGEPRRRIARLDSQTVSKKPELFDRALYGYLEMDETEFAQCSEGARALGERGMGANPLQATRWFLWLSAARQSVSVDPAVPADVRN